MVLSVIVPVYNAEKYLARCLESLLQQWPASRTDYEVICVNDGSIDRSGEVLHEYSIKYPQIIKIVEQENKGLSQARNSGLSIASGDYIAFCDADDYLAPGAYSYIYEHFGDNSFDVLRFCSITLDQYVLKTWKEPDKLSGNVVFEGSGLDTIAHGYFPSFVWVHLYKRSFLKANHLEMPQVAMCEDAFFNLDVYLHALKIKVVDTCAYRYTVSDTQITKKRDSATMAKAVNGYLQFFDRIHYYIETVPSVKVALNKLTEQKVFPCLSRALCADFDKAAFCELKRHLYQLDILPLASTSLSKKVVNLAMSNYFTFKFTSFWYSKVFVPFILPRLSRN